MSVLSMSANCISRPRPAPIETRNAISRWRVESQGCVLAAYAARRLFQLCVNHRDKTVQSFPLPSAPPAEQNNKLATTGILILLA
jgi:hypothetical protein